MMVRYGLKRFRTESGELAVSIATLMDLTKAEAEWYYIDGMEYNIHGLPYLCTRYVDPEKGRRVEFSCPYTGDCIEFPAEMMGLFLPDVSVDGEMIERVRW